MKSFLQGKWLGHALHPALVHLPTGLWPAALIFDLLANLGVGGGEPARVAFYAIALGLISALAAIPAGLADWLEIKPDRPARWLGLIHMLMSLIVTALWAVNLALRASGGMGFLPTPADPEQVGSLPLILSAAATGLLFISGYLGGRMVYDYGIGVARFSKDDWRRMAQAGGARTGKW